MLNDATPFTADSCARQEQVQGKDAGQTSFLTFLPPPSLIPRFQVRPRALSERTVPHRGAEDAWRAHQAFQRVGVLCRETKGLESLGLGHRGVPERGGSSPTKRPPWREPDSEIPATRVVAAPAGIVSVPAEPPSGQAHMPSSPTSL
jgi:hypothetical protein